MTASYGSPRGDDSGKLIWPARGAAGERLFWTLQAAGWTLVGILSLYPLLQIFSPPAITVILTLRVGSGVLFSWGLRWIYRRLRWREWPWWRLTSGGVAICVVLGALDSVVTHELARLALEALMVAPGSASGLHSFVLLMGILLRSSLYVIWSLLYLGVKLWLETAEIRLHAAQTEAAARTGELRQLRAQVNPHFLFNALNSILAEKNNPAAVEGITQELAEYLRFSLRPAGDYQPLGDELDALEHYLRVEKARFEEKLVYVISVAPEARGARVPVATVQPLLENAMKYGRLTSPAPLRIRITAAVDPEAGVLRVTVANTGRWIEFDAARSHGIGLTNLRRRLELLFREDAGLTHSAENGWVRVEVELPIRLTGAAEHAGISQEAVNV